MHNLQKQNRNSLLDDNLTDSSSFGVLNNRTGLNKSVLVDFYGKSFKNCTG